MIDQNTNGPDLIKLKDKPWAVLPQFTRNSRTHHSPQPTHSSRSPPPWLNHDVIKSITVPSSKRVMNADENSG